MALKKSLRCSQLQLRIAITRSCDRVQLELYVLAMLKRQLTCLYKDRRPTDLFAAVLFSFQGANSFGFSAHCVSFDRIFAPGRPSHDGYIIAAGYPCQASYKTFFWAPTNVAARSSPDFQTTTNVALSASPLPERL